MKNINTTKKTNIIINVFDKTIIVSKSYYKRACVYGTAEYAELRGAMMDNAEFTIVFKTSDKKTYGGLSLEKMAQYIQMQDNSGKLLVEFERVKAVAKAKNSLYPLTKKWFLNTFPAYKENDVSEAKREAAEEKEENDNIREMNTENAAE